MLSKLAMLALAAGAAVVRAADAPLVPVELYYESQCPGCQSFTTTTLKDVLAKPDIVEIIDLKLVAYGNTQKSGNSYSCQHGSGECSSDVYESCVEYKIAGSLETMFSASIDAWPFILCMEEADGEPLKAESCYNANMNSTGIPWSTIQDCHDNESDDVQGAAAAATPKHDYVPWVLVDNELLENQSFLQHAICSAYTGTPPESCKFVLTAPVGACFNENP